MTKSNKVPMVVTTLHRGVFFGYGVPTEKKIIKLDEAQMCIYWSADIKGVMGLSASGPSKSCKIGPIVPSITLQDVTAIFECSKESEKRWKEQPWG